MSPMCRGAACSTGPTRSRGVVDAGNLAGDILPPEESVSIMQTLDTIRAQIGLRYPGE